MLVIFWHTFPSSFSPFQCKKKIPKAHIFSFGTNITVIKKKKAILKDYRKMVLTFLTFCWNGFSNVESTKKFSKR